MAEQYCLAVDAMGGDIGPRLTVPAVCSLLSQHPQVNCQLHGRSEDIEPHLKHVKAGVRSRLKICHSPQIVTMEDKPASALRHKRDSSLWASLEAVASGEAQACISAGNTGALMAMGVALIGTLPGIERPAICTALPTYCGKVYLLDMGANLHCDADQLVQFAYMASTMVEKVESLASPRVGLLNIGRESTKGSIEVQRAADRLRVDEAINYCGFAEGDGIFSGDFDVIVCDGFVGNVALKTTEGVAMLIAGLIRKELRSSLIARMGALIAGPTLRRLKSVLNPAYYNGANLLGLNKTVIKSHGNTSEIGFANALRIALGEVDKNIPALISRRLSVLTENGTTLKV